MNVLNEAVKHVKILLPLQEIVIKYVKVENINGFASSTESEYKAKAYINYINPRKIEKQGIANAGASEYIKFYFNKDISNISFALNQDKSYIVFNNRKYEIYAKNDFHLNKWISVEGVGIKNV